MYLYTKFYVNLVLYYITNLHIYNCFYYNCMYMYMCVQVYATMTTHTLLLCN